MSNITIAVTNAKSPEYQQVWQLREEILRMPLGMSLKNEDLSMDDEDVILAAKDDDGKVIGCIMLHHLNDSTVKFRQMAVYNNWQGKNIGRMLMEAAEKHAIEKGYTLVSLHARKIVSGFYTRLGYHTVGDEFTEVGIPHLKMEKGLKR